MIYRFSPIYLSSKLLILIALLFFSELLFSQPVRIYFGGFPNNAANVKTLYEARFGIGNVMMDIVSDPSNFPAFDTTFADDSVFTAYDIVIFNDIADIAFQFRQSHINGLVNFYNQGGHIVLSLEGNTVAGTPFQVMELLFNTISGESIVQSPLGAFGTRDPPRFHPSNGPWGLSPTPNMTLSTQSYASFANMPGNSVVHQRNLSPPTCGNIEGVNVVYPPFPVLGQGTLYMTGEFIYPYNPTPDPDYTAHRNALIEMHHVMITNNQTKLNQLNTWVSNSSQVSVNLGNDTSICSGSGQGFLLTAGSPVNTYLWSTGATTPTLNITSSGIYHVTITGSTGCTDRDTIEVVIGNLQAQFAASQVACAGNASGSIQVNNVQGNAPFSFSLNNAPFIANSSFNNLPSGNYLISVKDNDGCQIDTSIVITEPLALNASISTQGVSCNGFCDGSANALATGGTPPYAYNWSNNLGAISQNSANAVCAANYSLTVSDANNCTVENVFTISTPSPISIFVDTTTTCVSDTITLNASASGGTGAPQINWNYNNTSANGNSLSLNIANDMQVLVFAQDNNACVSDTLSIQLLHRSTPTLNRNAPNGCVPFSASFSVSNGSVGDSYFWDFGNGNTAIGNNPAFQFQQIGIQPVQLITVSANQCLDTAQTQVEIFDSPLLSVFANEVCLGTTTEFMSSALLNDNSQISSWLWDFGDGAMATVQNPNHTFSIANTHNVSLVAITDRGCSADTTFEALVNENPIASFVAINICAGVNPNIFTNTSTISNGTILSFFWDFDDGFTSSVQSPSHLYSAPSVYDVFMRVTSDKFCSDSIIMPVTVYQSPIGFDFNFTEGCLGDSTKFSVQSLNADSSFNYAWDFGNGVVTNGLDPTHLFLQNGRFDVQLIVSTPQNCADTIKHSVQVFEIPTLNFEASNSCFGVNAVFENFSFLSSDSLNDFVWNFGDGNFSTTSNPVHLYGDTGAFAVQLTATSPQGCSDSLLKSIVVYPMPIADFRVENICQNEFLTITNNSLPANNNLSFTWFLNQDFLSIAFDPSFIASKAETFALTQIATLGFCSDTFTENFTVYPLPEIVFSVDKTFGIEDSTASFNFQNGSQNLATWEWDFGDGNFSSVLNPVHTYSDTGHFSITLSGSSTEGCFNSLSQPNYIQVIEKPRFFIPNIFSPNQDNNNDQFEIFATGVKQFQISIFDRWGEKVFETQSITDFWDGTWKNKKAPEGVYVYHGVVIFNSLVMHKFKGSVSLIR